MSVEKIATVRDGYLPDGFEQFAPRPSTRSALGLASVILGTVPIVAIILFGGLPVSCAVSVVLNYLALGLTCYQSRQSLLTPTIVFSGIVSTFGIAGYIFYNELADRGYYTAVLAVDDPTVRFEALTWFMLASFGTLIGASATRGTRGGHVSRSSHGITGLTADSRLAFGFAVLSAILNLSVRDFHDLLERSSYHIDTPIGGFMTYLQLPAAFLLGQCFIRSHWLTKIISIGLMSFFFAFSFALSSRLLSVTVLMFCTGLGMSARRFKSLPIAVGVLLAGLLIPLPLYLRGLPEQGLGPSLAALGGFSLFSPDAFWTTLGNLLSSFNIVALTGSVGDIPWDSLIQSVFPLPGFVFAANSTSDLRLNFAVPYAAVGEIANHGVVFLLLAFGGIGLISGFVERAVDSYRATHGLTAVSMIPLGISILSGFLFVQYNLSSAIRFQYGFLLVGIWLFVRSRHSRARV